ncbi:MAG: hypothetical protein WCK49_06670 [Myxococcaceae bacterium]
MILVYSLLEENRDRLITQLVNHVRGEDRLYQKISRLELKESISALYDAYVDFLVSKNKAKLSITLTYIVRSRVSQSFGLSAILKAALCFLPVFRVFFDDHKAMAYAEPAIFQMIERLIEIFEEQQQSKPKKNIDLSKLMIYRG